MKPLNFIGAQMLVFFGPFLESLIPGEQLYRFTELMEDRQSVERLLTKIEELEDKKKTAEKESRRLSKALAKEREQYKKDKMNNKETSKSRFFNWRK